MRLEDELKLALRREDPPRDFTERVLAGVGTGRSARRWWPAAIAATVLLTAGVQFEHQRHVRAEGERAKQQVMLALQITSRKLQFIKEKIHVTDSILR
jgi:hypothetical protein